MTDNALLGFASLITKKHQGWVTKSIPASLIGFLQFNGLSYGDLSASDWAVDKDGGRFDSFTGATITPRAVVNALKETLNYLRANPQLLETKQ